MRGTNVHNGIKEVSATAEQTLACGLELGFRLPRKYSGRLSAVLIALLAAGCTRPTKPQPKAPEKPPPPKIIMFYASPSVLRDNEPTQLCYSVEGATTLTLDLPVERVWPALSRCFEIKPAQTTTYKLTATEITIGPPRVKILEVSVNSLQIAKGEPFPFCVTARHAVNWRLSAGQWRTPPTQAGGCAVDHPTKTTTYTITAMGALGETDSERVTATVK